MTTKKNIFCTNCNKFNHEYKDCKEPITSWGIILVNLSDINSNINDQNSNKILNHSKNINIKNKVFNIFPQNYKQLEDLGSFMNNIKFLLIQRRHSIAFMDFLRGKYKIDNVDQINSLFQYMDKNEIELIKTKPFDELWVEMWNNDTQKINNKKREFIYAKAQFEKLKNGDGIDLNLDFFINNISPLYAFKEWGFPKGRKNKNESSLECAIREFSEETNIDPNKIKIIENINPIEENLIGTNGIPYRHIYYVAEIFSNDLVGVTNNNEIGEIGFFNYNESHELIRDYHTEKKLILQNLYMYYLEILLSLNVNIAVE
jgi:ADP-ribose pyrophosphatase YjhB (NUDIX family)